MNAAELARAVEERKFPPLLLLHGEESFLLERAVQRLRDRAVPPEARDFNLNTIEGREVRAQRLLDILRTFPVFASHRLVLVKDADEIPAAELDALCEYLHAPVPETLLVLTADKIDGRRKFFQEFRKRGEMVEFRRLNGSQIPAFVREQAREAGRALTEGAMALFCRRVGSGLHEVHGELVKLFSYLGEKTLADVADVAAVVSDTRVDSIFDLTNAIGRRNTGEALRLLNRLLDEGVAPLLVLNMLTRHFRQMWMARELLDSGVGGRDMAGRIGINPYFVDPLLEQARRFSPAGYRRAFELFRETDLALKSGGAHPAARLERLLLEIADT
jgi:DNA polymerase-3 subunit delta